MCYSVGGGANKCTQHGEATIDPVLSWIFQVYDSRAFQKTTWNLFSLNDTDGLNFAAWLKDYRGAVEDFFDLGFAANVKTYNFSWPVHSSISLVESLPFSWYCMRHEFGIRWKPSDYSKRKRSILRVHNMKLHGKINSSVCFTRNRHISKRIVSEICVL